MKAEPYTTLEKVEMGCWIALMYGLAYLLVWLGGEMWY